jgi:hypothetical protein
VKNDGSCVVSISQVCVRRTIRRKAGRLWYIFNMYFIIISIDPAPASVFVNSEQTSTQFIKRTSTLKRYLPSYFFLFLLPKKFNTAFKLPFNQAASSLLFYFGSSDVQGQSRTLQTYPNTLLKKDNFGVYFYIYFRKETGVFVAFLYLLFGLAFKGRKLLLRSDHWRTTFAIRGRSNGAQFAKRYIIITSLPIPSWMFSSEIVSLTR